MDVEGAMAYLFLSTSLLTCFLNIRRLHDGHLDVTFAAARDVRGPLGRVRSSQARTLILEDSNGGQVVISPLVSRAHAQWLCPSIWLL